MESDAKLESSWNLFSQIALSYLALIVFALFALYPISRIVTVALRPGDQLLSPSLALIPAGATFANFRILVTETPFLRWLGNSTLISLAVTITGVALASTAGYALSRFRFLGRGSTLNGLLVTQMFPATMLLLPLYLILIKLSLINSYLGVIIIYAATALPFCIWQLKGYYDTIPALARGSSRHRRLFALAILLPRHPPARRPRPRHHRPLFLHDRLERIRRRRPHAPGCRKISRSRSASACSSRT